MGNVGAAIVAHVLAAAVREPTLVFVTEIGFSRNSKMNSTWIIALASFKCHNIWATVLSKDPPPTSIKNVWSATMVKSQIFRWIGFLLVIIPRDFLCLVWSGWLKLEKGDMKFRTFRKRGILIVLLFKILVKFETKAWNWWNFPYRTDWLIRFMNGQIIEKEKMR